MNRHRVLGLKKVAQVGLQNTIRQPRRSLGGGGIADIPPHLIQNQPKDKSEPPASGTPIFPPASGTHTLPWKGIPRNGEPPASGTPAFPPTGANGDAGAIWRAPAPIKRRPYWMPSEPKPGVSYLL